MSLYVGDDDDDFDDDDDDFDIDSDYDSLAQSIVWLKNGAGIHPDLFF